MTDFPAERDDGRFQEVLGRLDALVKRGHPDDEPPPPPPAVSEATIPVLTEVYRPVHEDLPSQASVLQPSASGAPTDSLEQIVSEMLPGIAKVLEDAVVQQVRSALNEALNEAVTTLRPQIEEELRQHLLQVLTKEKD